MFAMLDTPPPFVPVLEHVGVTLTTIGPEALVEGST